MSPRKQLAENLKRMRKEKGWKQTDVAEKAAISANYYAKIERGTINTTIDKLEKIAKALGIEPSDLLAS
jgi:transcriptional regulator with XRE-family HTH domain